MSFDPAEAIEKLFDFLFRAFLGLMAAASFIFHLQYLLVNTPKGYFDNIPLGVFVNGFLLLSMRKQSGTFSALFFPDPVCKTLVPD
ncbi:MAG: hypothetical protein ACLR1T_15300 [Evtepia gabavorous]